MSGVWETIQWIVSAMNGRSPRLFCRAAIGPGDNGNEADRQTGGQPPAPGRVGSARSRSRHPVLQAEDSAHSDSVSPCRRLAELTRGQHQD